MSPVCGIFFCDLVTHSVIPFSSAFTPPPSPNSKRYCNQKKNRHSKSGKILKLHCWFKSNSHFTRSGKFGVLVKLHRDGSVINGNTLFSFMLFMNSLHIKVFCKSINPYRTWEDSFGPNFQNKGWPIKSDTSALIFLCHKPYLKHNFLLLCYAYWVIFF